MKSFRQFFDGFFDIRRQEAGRGLLMAIILGSSGKLRRGNIGKTDLTAKGFDQDNAFMLADIEGDRMSFRVMTRSGKNSRSGKHHTSGKDASGRSSKVVLTCWA